jgi:hypothetical protein
MQPRKPMHGRNIQEPRVAADSHGQSIYPVLRVMVEGILLCREIDITLRRPLHVEFISQVTVHN